MTRRVRLLLTLAAATLAATPAGASAFEVGFADHLFGGESGGRWATRAASTGADAIRVNLYWSVVAVSRPQDPRDPDDPAYDFSPIDRAVRNADRAGLDVLLTVLSAPPWAEGPDRPSFEEAPAGTWRPDPEQFGDFAHALATRYSGAHPDPETGGVLPRIDRFAAWNEPNISQYLTPQFEDGRNESAATYVELLNAFGDAILAVNADAVISTGGTAPFGDLEGRRRTAPLEFWREVLCLDPGGTRSESCASDERPRFDLLAHHPISYLSSPSISAAADDDVTAVDFGQLGRLLEAAEEAGTIDPDEEHGLLAPEIWWETDPPERVGISLGRQARYTALAMYLLWRQGADGVYFLQLRDAQRRRGEPRLRSYQTGVYTYGDRRKPSWNAVRFPVVGDRVSPERVLLWARSPATGRMRLERKVRGGHWSLVRTVRAEEGEILTEEFRFPGRGKLRARVAGIRSPAWLQRR